MTLKLVICRFSEQKYMILNLCTFFGTPSIKIHFLRIYLSKNVFFEAYQDKNFAG